MRLSDQTLKRIFPTLPASKRLAYAPLLVAAMEEFGVSTRRRACAFLAQVGHESADLKYFEELASGAAYEGRRDLGNTQPGDGRRYKGRGPIQITGRANYLKAGDALQIDLLAHPQLLAIPENGFRAAAWWWKQHNLNAAADRLTLKADANDLARFDQITKTINGGYNGRVDRQTRYLDCVQTISEGDEANAPIRGTKPTLDETKPASADTPVDLVTRLATDPNHRSAAMKLGTRFGTPLSTLLLALQAGSVYAWLGLAIVVIGLGLFIYFERRAIARAIQPLLGKL